MARKLRIEFPGARYHVINRGNYRDHVFAEDGAKQAFLKCLGEATFKAGWVVHAYVLMSNHYHLALETPAGNLVEGMRWLQATFSNRFNRFRGERGHVFQGRYQALVIEPDGLGAVAHYIHLNPVRARLLPIERLGEFADSSYAALLTPKQRPEWLCVDAFLDAAGELADTPAGRRKYGEYLTWLAQDKPAQKQLNFDTMSRGWALGGDTFKAALARKHRKQLEKSGSKDATTREARELLWSAAFKKALFALGKKSTETAGDIKSAPWKVAIAAHLKAATTVSNPWLAAQLHMGAPEGVSRYVTELREGKRPDAAKLIVRLERAKH
jgi:REP element-mobilizing transposase RayT